MAANESVLQQSLFKKLKDVSTYIMKGHVPRDDTLIGKLLTYIQSVVTDDDSVDVFTREVGFLDLTNQLILQAEDVDKDSYVYACQVITHLVKTTERGRDVCTRLLKQLLLLPNHIGLWGHPSVRNLVILGLTVLLDGQPDYVTWIIETGLSSMALKCLNNDSIFVTKSAVQFGINFTSTLLMFKGTGDTKDVDLEMLNSASTRMANCITVPLQQKATCKSALDVTMELPVAVEIIHGMLNLDWSRTWFDEVNLMHKLHDVVLNRSDIDHNSLRNIAEILHSDTLWRGAVMELKVIVEELIEKGKYITAITMASVFYNRIPTMRHWISHHVINFIMLSASGVKSGDIESREIQGKTSVTKLLCFCLTALENMAPTLGSFEMLLLVLKATTDSSLHYIYHNRRIQQACLKATAKLLSSAHPMEEDSEDKAALHSVLHSMLQLCISLLHPCDVSCSFTGAIFNCVHQILKIEDSLMDVGIKVQINGGHLGMSSTMRQCYGDEASGDLLSDLAENVKRKLCDRQWEIRDAALEFLKCMLTDRGCKDRIKEWFAEHGLAVQLWHSVSDGESYVRATALSALTHLLSWPILKHKFLNDVHECVISEKMNRIVTEDTEAFPRRAAIGLLHQFWRSKDDLDPYAKWVNTLVKHALNDLDWQVKLATLEIYSDIIDKVHSHNLIDAGKIQKICSTDDLKLLWDYGCADVLVLAAQDEDRSVQLAACKLVVVLQTICRNVGEMDSSAPREVADFVTELNLLDTDILLTDSSKSMYEYANPDSLLDDIKTAVIQASQVENESQKEVHYLTDEEDYFVDCY